MQRHVITVFVLVAAMLSHVISDKAPAWPLDGYEATGIDRLQHTRLLTEGGADAGNLPSGALLTTEQVDIRMADSPALALPPVAKDLTRRIVAFLGKDADRYSISVLDLSNPDAPRYAEHRGEVRINPGSVGKLVVAMAIFQLLADLYPKDKAARLRILHDTVVTADDFIRYDTHPVSIRDPDSGRLLRRRLHIGDRGNLWEFLDWMLSASSNAAASMVIKQGMLLKQFGHSYPVSKEEQDRFFRDTPKQQLSNILAEVLQTPVARNGLDPARLRQGAFFTAIAKQRVPGTSSYATSRELMRYLLKLEQGRLVDEFSSRQIKRLLYMTERRIRYASAPALRDAAVYFKSGSLYKCRPEPDFTCRKYHGNVWNMMNSVAIIEAPAGERKLFYMVTLMSNVLRENSAVVHQTLAMRIHRLMQKDHAR
jgi:hypothetical protein